MPLNYSISSQITTKILTRQAHHHNHMLIRNHGKTAIVLKVIIKNQIPIIPLCIAIIHQQPHQRILNIIPILQLEIHPYEHCVVPGFGFGTRDGLDLCLDVLLGFN